MPITTFTTKQEPFKLSENAALKVIHRALVELHEATEYRVLDPRREAWIQMHDALEAWESAMPCRLCGATDREVDTEGRTRCVGCGAVRRVP